MGTYRIYIEETSVRLFSREVEAASKDAANELAQQAIEDDSWTEWDHSSSDCSVEARPEITERRTKS